VKKISENSRVRWYEYSSDGMIKQTGLGIVICIESLHWIHGEGNAIVILCDSGETKTFHGEDIELYEEWKNEI